MTKAPLQFRPVQRRQWLRASVSLALLACTHSRGQALHNRILRVGFIAHHEPFSFAGQNRQLVGFDVEVVHALLASMGWQMQAESGRLEQLRQKIRAGELDLLGNQLLIVPENRRWFDFVQPYVSMRLVCVQHQDDERDFFSLDDFVGKRLGVLRDTGIEQQVRAALGSGTVPFDRIELAFAALGERKLDAVLEENLIAEYHIERDGLPLRLGAPMTAAHKVGLAVAKGNKTLQQALSEGLAKWVKDPEFARISRRWFGYDVSKPNVSHVSASEG